jgi:hypothetical protein
VNGKVLGAGLPMFFGTHITPRATNTRHRVIGFSVFPAGLGLALTQFFLAIPYFSLLDVSYSPSPCPPHHEGGVSSEIISQNKYFLFKFISISYLVTETLKETNITCIKCKYISYVYLYMYIRV